MIATSTKKEARAGDTVTIEYTLMLDDGTVYYSSIGGEPLKATLGQGMLIPGFEDEVIGMRVGETRTFTLPPEKAYGNYRPEMIGTFDRSMLPEGVEPEIGKQIQANLKDGTQTMAVITSFTDTTVTLDANHPLVGQTLTFDIKLLAIENPAPARRNNQAYLSWIIFALGASTIGFILFNRRTLRGSIGARRGARVKSAHYKSSP